MTQQIYTLGYSGRSPAEIKQLVDNLDAVLLDIRFSPRSRIPHWAGKNLRALLGETRYQHLKALGNRNYKGGPIALVDYEAGQAAITQAKRPVILMCVCHDYHTCHRAVVAERLRAAGFQVTELGPDDPTPQQPNQPSLF